jgi:histone deacetylase 1/2
LRAFGCACWPYLRPYNRHKLDFRSKCCIFIGYSIAHQGYKCLDVTTRKIFISRHVVFDESIYLYTVPPSNSFTPKLDPVVLPPNHHLSSSSALISAGTITQPPAPSQLHMVSPSRPSNSLHYNSASPASNPIPSPLQNNTDPAPSPSPPQRPVPATHPMITRSKITSTNQKSYLITIFAIPFLKPS